MPEGVSSLMLGHLSETAVSPSANIKDGKKTCFHVVSDKHRSVTQRGKSSEVLLMSADKQDALNRLAESG